jgi:signal transduction histidine kinase
MSKFQELIEKITNMAGSEWEDTVKSCLPDLESEVADLGGRVMTTDFTSEEDVESANELYNGLYLNVVSIKLAMNDEQNKYRDKKAYIIESLDVASGRAKDLSAKVITKEDMIQGIDRASKEFRWDLTP